MRRARRLPSFEDYLFAACERVTRTGGEAKLLSTKPVGADLVVLQAGIEFEKQEVTLDLFEVVRRTVSGGHYRYRYRYRCWLTGQPVFRYERDPDGHPEMPDHKHLYDGTRIASDEVTLDGVLDSFWDEVEREQRRRDRERQRSSVA